MRLFMSHTPAQRERVILVFRERLKRLAVGRHPALFFNPWVEGYREYTFGGRAGPSVQVNSLFHELGHAAQFGPEMFRTRAADTGFYFKVPQRFIFDRYCTEPTTQGATLRELHTFAHQLHLMKAAGCKVRDDDFFEYGAKLMRFMHDWWHVPGDSDESRAAYCAEVIAQEYARLSAAESLDRLEAWLDKTASRLKRRKLDLATWSVGSVTARYHAGGQAYVLSPA